MGQWRHKIKDWLVKEYDTQKNECGPLQTDKTHSDQSSDRYNEDQSLCSCSVH